MRKAGVRLGVAGLLIILTYLAAAGLGGLVPGPVADVPPGDGAPVEVGLVAGPIHVDFVLPATADTRAALADARLAGVPVDHPQARFFVVGWGAREFYTTAGSYADVTARAVIRAVFGDRSVLRVAAIGPIPGDAEFARLDLSPGQYQRLLAEIAASATAVPVPRASLSPDDGFLEARGRFHIFRTCNTWVTTMLRAAGVEAGIWTPTPYAVRLSLWRFPPGRG